ncbi:hypothetical protein RUND412_011438, partial [Rhizina undulata]
NPTSPRWAHSTVAFWFYSFGNHRNRRRHCVPVLAWYYTSVPRRDGDTFEPCF